MSRQVEPDRPAEEGDVEVTEEMINVGVDAYLGLSSDIGDIETRVEIIYCAMALAKKE